MTFYLPANCQLVITGPEYIQLGLTTHYEQQQGYAPVPQYAPALAPTPQATPYAVPGMIPQPGPYNVPVPAPQSFTGHYEIQKGFAPAYASPQPMPQAPVLAPMRVPQPIAQRTPEIDPAKAAMAAYIAARNEDAAHRKMQAELDEQVEKAMKAVSEAGVASPSAGAAMDPKA